MRASRPSRSITKPVALMVFAAIVYTCARVASTVACGPVIGPDSRWYRVLDWSGHGRPWTVPAITWWDRAIYSESLSISLAVAAAAALVLHYRDRQSALAVLAAACLSLWTLTRSANAPITALVALVVLATAAAKRSLAIALIGILLLGTAATGLLLAQRNEYGVAVADPVVRAQIGGDTIDTETPNVVGVLQRRVFPDAGRRAWFVAHGMPDLARTDGDLLAEPVLRAWAKAHGTSTYMRYAVTHPWWAVSAPTLEDVDHMLAPKGLFGSTNLDDHRAPWFSTPRLVANALLSNFTVLIAGSAVAMTVAARHRKHVMLIAVGGVLSTWPQVLVAWHGSVAELDRLSISATALARLNVIVILAAAPVLSRAERMSAAVGGSVRSEPQHDVVLVTSEHIRFTEQGVEDRL